jgi:hypothetical protein
VNQALLLQRNYLQIQINKIRRVELAALRRVSGLMPGWLAGFSSLIGRHS